MSTPVYDYLQLLQTVLGEIRTSNDYLTDLGANVTLEDAQQLDDAGSRIVVLQTALGRPESAAFNKLGGRVGIAVVAQYGRGVGDTQLRLHRAQSDVMRCLGDTDLLRTKFQFTGMDRPFPQFDESVMAPQVDGVAWVGVAVRYSAHLRFR